MWSILKEKLMPGRLRSLLEGILRQLKRPNLVGEDVLQIQRIELRAPEDIPPSSRTQHNHRGWDIMSIR